MEPPVSVQSVSHGEICRDSRGGAAAGAAGHTVRVNRVADGTVGGVFVGRAHGELIAIQFAEENGACGFKLADSGGVIGRLIALEDFGARRGRRAFDYEYVFDADGNAGEGSKRIAFGC